MALDYGYELATPETPRRVAELVCTAAQTADLIDPVVTADQVLDGWTTRNGTWFRVRDGTTRFPINVVEQSFGFAPTVRVTFTLVSAEDLDPQQDEAWLLRRGGDLSVSKIDYRWPAHRLALLPRPYRRVSYSLT